MSRILVTGGAGFVGSNLVSRLISEKHEVIVLDDLSSGFRVLYKDAHFVQGSITDEDALSKCFHSNRIMCAYGRTFCEPKLCRSSFR